MQTSHFIVSKLLLLVNHRIGSSSRTSTATLHGLPGLILKGANPFIVTEGISGR